MKCERMKGEVEPETKKFRVFRDFICDAVDEEDAFQQFGEWEEHHEKCDELDEGFEKMMEGNDD